MDTTTKTRTRRTQEERKAESHERIIEAATELFASQGYLGTTLNQIGKKAGYTGGLISNRYGSKESLLREVLDNISKHFEEDFKSLLSEGQSAAQALEVYVDFYLREATRHGSRLQALFVVMGEALGAMRDINDDVARFNKATRGLIKSLVIRGIKSGEFRKDIDADASALMILGLLRGTALQWFADRKSVKILNVIPQIQSAVIDPLVERKAAGRRRR